MEGAIEAGERAARQVIHVMGKISESQVWVDEPFCADDNFPVVPLPTTFVEKILPSVPQFLCIGATSVFAAVVTVLVHKYFK